MDVTSATRSDTAASKFPRYDDAIKRKSEMITSRCFFVSPKYNQKIIHAFGRHASVHLFIYLSHVSNVVQATFSKLLHSVYMCRIDYLLSWNDVHCLHKCSWLNRPLVNGFIEDWEMVDHAWTRRLVTVSLFGRDLLQHNANATFRPSFVENSASNQLAFLSTDANSIFENNVYKHCSDIHVT